MKSYGKPSEINWGSDAVLLDKESGLDGNLPYVSKAGIRAIEIGFLRRNEAGRHQKYQVTARKEMKHVKASSEDEEPLNTSLFFMKAIFEEAEKEASLSLRMF